MSHRSRVQTAQGIRYASRVGKTTKEPAELGQQGRSEMINSYYSCEEDNVDT